MKDDNMIYGVHGEGVFIGEWALPSIPKNKSRLIVSDDISFYSKNALPKIWYRFWLRLLFGWRWERVE